MSGRRMNRFLAGLVLGAVTRLIDMTEPWRLYAWCPIALAVRAGERALDTAPGERAQAT